MDIHEYLGVLRRGIVLIVLGVLIGLAGGLVAQTVEKPSYSATSRDLLTNKVAGDLSISQGRIASYVLVASSGLVLQPVIDDLGLTSSVDQLAQHISVVAPPNTVVIEITATAATPEEARDIANSVSDHFADVVADQLETTTGVTPTAAPTPTPGPDGTMVTPKPSPSTTRLPNGTVVPVAVPTAPVRVVNLEQAALPTAPNASNGPLMLLVGGVLGVALGLLAASLREAVDRRVRSPRDVARVTDVPVVGAVVADRALRTELTARAGVRAPSAESFRALRAHIDHLRTRDDRRLFVVTAADRRQGASTVAANLAIAIANTGTSVVLVDADLRRPALAGMFEVNGARGLSDVLTGTSELDAVLRRTGTPHLTVLPAGPVAANAPELLATARMRAVLAELAARYDVVLIDTTTIAAASDAAVLGAQAGSTLLVIRHGAITRPWLDEALALLEAGGSTPVGIVLTRTRRTVAGRAPAASRGGVEVVSPARELVATPVVPAPSVPSPAAPPPAAPAPAAPASPAPAVGAPETPVAAKRARTTRRATAPATTTVVPTRPAVASPAPSPVTEVEHTISTARKLDSAFAALPTATAAELRAETQLTDTDPSHRLGVERPIVIRPDARPVSRFAPAPSKVGERRITGTVVDTVSIRLPHEALEAPSTPPPIRHILPRPGSTLPPPTLPVGGSLLGEIGGLPRVEVRTAGQTAVTDTAPNPERDARESYEQRAHQLERVAHERLMREQQRLAGDIREQLAHDKRELESMLDNRLEDTIRRPRAPLG